HTFLSRTSAGHRYPHSFPTRRSSDLIAPASYLNDTLEEGLLFAQDLAESGNVAQAVPIAATLYTYAAIVSSGIKAEKTSFNYNQDRKSTRLNSSHVKISYAVFCLKKK